MRKTSFRREATIDRHVIQWAVTFLRPFSLCGNVLPAGRYQISAEVDASRRPGGEAWNQVQFHITIEHWGRTERRPIDLRALDRALSRDRSAVAADADVMPDRG